MIPLPDLKNARFGISLSKRFYAAAAPQYCGENGKQVTDRCTVAFTYTYACACAHAHEEMHRDTCTHMQTDMHTIGKTNIND